jgi:PAS domain S-box-containing protein
VHKSELITAEIEGRYGFFPSFFAPALPAPDVLEQLWRATLACYLDNPLPEAFKERLFAYLSRLRSNAYCTVRHSCQLRELGASAHEIFDLLEARLSPDPASVAHLLGVGEPLARRPLAGSPEEGRIVVLAAHVFVGDELAAPCLDELRRLLGRADLSRLVLLLSHVTACHEWVRAHPEISHQDDEHVLRHLPALIREEPRLAEMFDGHSRTSTLARRDHLAAIVESADDAIIGETLEGAIVSWNRAAERLYGYSAEMVLGMSVGMLVPVDRGDEAAEIMRQIRCGERAEPFDTVRVGMDGVRLDVSLTVSTLRGASGAVSGASSIARDIGERKLRERYLQTLHNATRVLAQSRSIEETLPIVLRVVGEGMGWSVAATWMPTTRPGVALQLRCAAFWHAAAFDDMAFETTSRQLRLGAGEGLPGRVWETRQARWVPDVAAEPHSRRADEASQDGLHTCYLLPVRGRDELVAVVEFLSAEIRPPDPILLEMLNRISGQIGEFLERRAPKRPRLVAGAADGDLLRELDRP